MSSGQARRDLQGLLRDVRVRGRLNWSALSKAGRASVVGVALSALLAMSLGVLLPRIFVTHALHARLDAVHSMVHTLEGQGLIPAMDEHLSGDTYARFDDVVRGGLLGGENTRVKLWSPSGEVVYSDRRVETGQIHPRDPGLREALSGSPFAEIRPARGHTDRSVDAETLVLLVPFHEEGSPPHGVFEVHQDIGALGQHLTLVTRAVWVAVGTGLSILLLFLFSLFAGTARVMERERRAAEDRAEDLSVLVRTSRSLSSDPTLAKTAPHVLSTLVETLNLRCAALVLDGHGPDTALAPTGRGTLCPLGRDLARRTCRDGETAGRTVAAVPALDHAPPGGRCTILSTPFQARPGACGALVACRDHGAPLGDREGTVLAAVAGQIGFAADNDRLFGDLGEMTAVRGRLLRRLVHAQEEERRHLVGDLHDGLGQGLTRVLHGLRGSRARISHEDAEVQRELEHLEVLVDEQSRSLRGYMRAIRPAVLEDFGLAKALVAFAREQELETGIPVAVSVDGTPALGTPTEIVLYRAAQEAVMNARKHARAGRISLHLRHRGDDAILEVRDDGRGSDEIREGTGLRSMRDRVASLGGTVEVRSDPGRGTRVKVRIPMEPEHGHDQDVRR